MKQENHDAMDSPEGAMIRIEFQGYFDAQRNYLLAKQDPNVPPEELERLRQVMEADEAAKITFVRVVQDMFAVLREADDSLGR